VFVFLAIVSDEANAGAGFFILVDAFLGTSKGKGKEQKTTKTEWLVCDGSTSHKRLTLLRDRLPKRKFESGAD
jgi:hypothetical protein